MPDTRFSSTAMVTMPKRLATTGLMNGPIVRKAMQAYLNENVFMGMVLSCVEVYKKECFGLLLGYRTPEKYIVEHAIPYQTVRRGHNWAELSHDKWKVIQEILKNFPKLDVLGDFHSHTMYRDIKAQVSLSRDDIEYMDPQDLQIVIAVNEKKRTRDWSLNSDRTISGSIDRFYFKIAAYYFDHPSVKDFHPLSSIATLGGGACGGQAGAGARQNGNGGRPGRPRMADILCPFVMGINHNCGRTSVLR
jgi:proteasome lid subunit RPN8/RPN11